MKFKDIFAVDKVAHFGVCFALTVIVSACFRNGLGPVLGMIAALVAGVAKEIYDKKHGGPFSLGDIVADFAGAVVGGICAVVLLATQVQLVAGF